MARRNCLDQEFSQLISVVAPNRRQACIPVRERNCGGVAQGFDNTLEILSSKRDKGVLGGWRHFRKIRLLKRPAVRKYVWPTRDTEPIAQ